MGACKSKPKSSRELQMIWIEKRLHHLMRRGRKLDVVRLWLSTQLAGVEQQRNQIDYLLKMYQEAKLKLIEQNK